MSFDSFSQKFCGDTIPGRDIVAGVEGFVSPSAITIKMHTDDSRTRSGFDAMWRGDSGWEGGEFDTTTTKPTTKTKGEIMRP